jgi:hypothetical protein
MSPGAVSARFAADRNANLEDIPMKCLILALVIGLSAASTAHAGGKGAMTGEFGHSGTQAASTTSSPSGGRHSSGGQQGGGVTPDGSKPGIAAGQN